MPRAFAVELPKTLAPFEGLPSACTDTRLIEGAALVEALVTDHVLEVFGELGISVGRLKLENLADDVGVALGRRPAFDWLTRHLAGQGMLDGYARELLAPPWTPQSLAEARERLSDIVGPTLPLLERAAGHYPAFLRGERLGAQILFDAESMPLWEAYFSNDNPFNRAFNELAAHAAKTASEGRTGLRVLEVGGGCGSSGVSLLEALGEQVASYTYSDVAPTLLVRGRRALQAAFPDANLAFQRVDIDKPLLAQRIEPASFDLIHGVNTLHVARDLVATLEHLHEALAPGGVLVLGEATRPAPGRTIGFEFIFQLTETFQTFVPTPGLRTEPGFLAWEQWPPVLERAGFTAVRTIPDMPTALDAYPDHTLCAVTALRS